MSELKSKIQEEVNTLLESVQVCETNIRNIIKTEGLFNKKSYTAEEVQNLMEVMSYLSTITLVRATLEEV